MEKVLVTGGAGFVGSSLVPTLLEKGYRVEVLDNMMHENSYSGLSSYVQGRTLISHPNFCGLTKGDIRDEKLVSNSMSRNDIIIHLAAIVGAPACDKQPELARSTNLNGTRNILENLSKNQKIIFASTGSNYGKVEKICTEETPLNPLSLYGKVKTQSEKEIMSEGGVAYRFATAFGVSPRFRMDLLINDFSYRIVNVRHLDVFEANAKRTFIHVADMANAILFGINNYDQMKGEAFNIGDEKMNISKENVAKKIISKTKQIYGFDAYLFTEEKEKRFDPDQRDYEVCYEKIQKVGKGFRTKISMEEGLEELIKFYSFVKIRNPFSNV